MYLVYLGESGNTGNSLNDPNQPHHVHVGLLVHESQSISITGEFNALCRRHFGRFVIKPLIRRGRRPSFFSAFVRLPTVSSTCGKAHWLGFER